MRRVIIAAMLLAFTVAAYPVLGKLDDFKKDVENEEREDRGKSSDRKSGDRKSGGSGSAYHDSFSDTDSNTMDRACADAMCSCFGEYLSLLWTYHSFSLCYARFPYDAKRNGSFVNKAGPAAVDNADNGSLQAEGASLEKKQNAFEWSSTKTAEKRSANVPVVNPPGTRSWYFTLESAGQYAFDEGGAYAGRISGKFWRFIGPEFSIRVFHDGDDTLVMYHPGINISFFQHNNFSMDGYVQVSVMKGVMERTGVAYGALFTSYPVKPMMLMFRAGGISYENIDFWDLEGRIGLVFGRVEVFAGYQYMQAKYAGIGGPFAGVRVFL